MAIESEPSRIQPPPPTADVLSKPSSVSGKVYWPYAGSFLILHLMLPLAFVPWLFSWTGVVLVFVGSYVFGTLGINLAYHRVLTHQGMELPKWLERTFATLGVCSLQDAPARWVAVHRMHHQHSDERPDPHSPLVTFLWGHVGWLIFQNDYFGTNDMYDRYARDILRDRYYFWLEKRLGWLWIYLAQAPVFFGIGFLIGTWLGGTAAAGLQFGASILFWGVIVRTVYVWHITWAVNSATHLWGYQNYETRDNSRNNWLVALISNGEGWHNNHHADPRAASHGHRWWELDVTYWTVLLLEKLGLATDVVRPNRRLHEHRAIDPS